ncbi:MAG: hypothetical protein LQ338_003450 [Usnochroma carphineum]|nr:MAG: hypothetical protein LQ338_003450 [Usnochroma carphineum]
MAASPALSYPADILTLDPKWAGCGADAYYWAFDDPPSALTPVSVLVTVSTHLDSTRTSAPQATPAVQPNSINPSPGDTASLVPIAKTSKPPSNSDPPSPSGSPSPVDPSSRPDSLSPSDPRSPADPPSPSGAPSPAEPPSRPDPSSDLNPRPSALPDNPATGEVTTEPMTTEVHASNNPTKGPSRSSFVIATVGSQQVYVLPDGGVSVQGMTIAIGDPAITVDNMPISADSRSIYIGGSAYETPSPSEVSGLPPSIISDQHIEAASAGAILFGGRIISEGQRMTVDGQTISNGQGRMVIGGTTVEKPPYRIPVATDVPTPLPSAIGSKSLEFDGDGALVFDGKSMFSGQQTTIDGKHVVMEASKVAIDSTTYSLPMLSHPAAAEPTGWSTQINSDKVVFDHDGRVVLDGLTMSPGEQTTAKGTYISIGQAWAVMGGHTYSAPSSSDALKESQVTQSSTVDNPMASPSNSALVVPGEAVGEADKGPTTSTSGVQNNPGDDSGLGAMIMSAFGSMSSQTTQASSAATPGGPSALTTSSGILPTQSSGLGHTPSRSLWIALAAAVFVVLLQLLY